MDIEVGEYVRDRDGIIIKVNSIEPEEDSEDIWYEEKILAGTWKSMIVKHSKNIIDLIKVGDYVNGEKVLSVDWGSIGFKGFEFIEPNEIKSIVTKEQFKNIEYIVED